MSIPFSNTTLRIPRGFGNLLEGLAREVLRNQPKDIPTFAALYFTALLKEREESGQDPAEWGAKLEDRFYNNHAFKETEKEADGSSEPQKDALDIIPEKSAADTLGYIEQELIQPVHIATVASANFHIFDDVPGMSCDEDGMGSKASEDIGGVELAPSPEAPYKGVADVDICAEGLGLPGGLGEFDLSTVVKTPTPMPTPLPVPEEIPTALSPGTVPLDFQDDAAEQMQDATPGNGVRDTTPRMDVAEQVRGEVPETPGAMLDHGGGQEENEMAAEIDDTLGYIEQEIIQPAHISTVASANFHIFDDVPGVSCGEDGMGAKASEDIGGVELAPSPEAPFKGVADVDIGAKGLGLPGGLGEFDLATVVRTPTPMPTPLPVPEEIPTALSPGTVPLDFQDDAAGQMQDATPGNGVRDTTPRMDAAETPGAMLDHGGGQEENEVAAEIDDTLGYIEQDVIQPVHISTVSSANFHIFDDVPGVSCGEDGTKPELHSKGGDTSGNELQTGKEEPPLRRDYTGEEDPTLGRASSQEADPPLRRTSLGEDALALGRASPGDDEPPLGRASSREEDPPLRRTSLGEDDLALGRASPGEEDPPFGRASLRKDDLPLGRASPGEDDPPLRRASPREEDTLLGRASLGEDDLPSGRASPGEDDPPLRRASPREEDTPLERALPEEEDPALGITLGNILTQKAHTEEAEATNRDTPPQNSAGMTNASDDKADDHEDNCKEETKIDASVADAKSYESKGDVSITAEQQDKKELEPGKDAGSLEMEQGIQLEEQGQDKRSVEQVQDERSDKHEQDKESEEHEQGKALEEQDQGEETEELVQDERSEELVKESEEQLQGQEPEEQIQGEVSEEQDQGEESPEQGQDKRSEELVKDSEEQLQGHEPEEQGQDKELEEQRQGEESEEQGQGEALEEQGQDKISEEQGQGEGLEEQGQGEDSGKQGQGEDSELEEQGQGEESEEQQQGEESKEQGQGEESQEQQQGEESKEQGQGEESQELGQGQESEETKEAKSEEQVPVVITEVSMIERDPKEERVDPFQRHSDEEESAHQEEEKVHVGEEVEHKEESLEPALRISKRHRPVIEMNRHEEECSQAQEEEDVLDIPLDDPEANKAAAKIQAGFRGHMTRKKMKDDKPAEENQQDQKD